ncbi:unnamed protein product, partial [Pylaiella littoralis]
MLVTSFGDGDCSVWSFLNSLREFERTRQANLSWQQEMKKKIKDERTELWHSLMEEVFTVEWEQRQGERISKEEEGRLTHYCYDRHKFEHCSKQGCRRYATFLNEEGRVPTCAGHTKEGTGPGGRVMLTIGKVATEWWKSCHCDWLSVFHLPYVADSLECTVAVWEPAPGGKLRVFVDSHGVPAVFIGGDKSSERVVHLLYHGGEVRSTQQLSGAHVWDRSNAGASGTKFTHFDCLMLPQD